MVGLRVCTEPASQGCAALAQLPTPSGWAAKATWMVNFSYGRSATGVPHGMAAFVLLFFLMSIPGTAAAETASMQSTLDAHTGAVALSLSHAPPASAVSTELLLVDGELADCVVLLVLATLASPLLLVGACGRRHHLFGRKTKTNQKI